MDISSEDFSYLRADIVALKQNVITLNNNIEKYNTNMEYQLFMQEWNMAVEYFRNKRPGPLPSDEDMVDWIAKNRLRFEQNKKLLAEKVKGLKR